MVAAQRPGLNLQELATRMKAAVSNGATAPLIVAQDVVQLAAHWDEYKQEAGGVECTTWLQSICGGGINLSWWSARNEAVERLGESCRRTTDHHVAVWAARKLDDESIRRAALILRREQKQNHGVPISMMMARRVFRAEGLIGKVKHRHCERCRLLEKTIRELGGEVPG